MSGARSTSAWLQLVLLGGLFTSLLSGCGGYRLGPSNGFSARERSVYVQPFVNDTLQPRIEDDFTHSVRIGFQREGTFRLGSRADCDVILEGVIRDYKRQGLSYNPTDLVQVQDYTLVAVAHITAYERSTGKELLNQDVSGSTQVRAGNDLLSAERQATPLLANSLALKVVDLLADGTW